MDYHRNLNLKKEVLSKSCFLLGPRGTGKSFWIRKSFPKDVPVFNLLDDDVYMRFLRRPRQLGDEIPEKHKLVVIDEIQKLPKLLDEVHRLIEERSIHFLLTGSSARKLKRGGANLLAGRARMLEFFPLTFAEISDFDLVKFCNVGGIPSIYLSDDPETDLKNYVQLYIKEEVQAEALVRNVGNFTRFLDVTGAVSGLELNFQEISSDSGVPVRTVSEYVEVLKDTLLAYELKPYLHTSKRKSVSKSKLYLFDVGVANHMSGRRNIDFKSTTFGFAFEHFILQEIRAHLSLSKSSHAMTYWRTSQQHEVDCIVGDEYAIEIKATQQALPKHLKDLKVFREENAVKKYIFVSNDPIEKTIDGIRCYPWGLFLKKLHQNKL